ncbi:MAG: YraN family protein [Syntrophorhabdaceae bacterium]|nr:YraN family protein [Syntrophorhabdaceae bacterium]
MTFSPRERLEAGLAAEERACRYLEAEGFSIVERNHRSRTGEIDIVARKEGLLLFAEVRFRGDVAFGSPEDTVNLKKRLRVVTAARHYLADAALSVSWDEARFDVIVIEGTGEDATLRHYPAAFDAKGKVL